MFSQGSVRWQPVANFNITRFYIARELVPYVVVCHIVMGAAAMLAAALRLFGAPGARVATRAASFVLILWIPTGTALFVWWLLDVRKREAP